MVHCIAMWMRRLLNIWIANPPNIGFAQFATGMKLMPARVLCFKIHCPQKKVYLSSTLCIFTCLQMH